jgi:ketosteroid isomerase-like protein
MSPTFTTPQDAEDAYYDALEDGDLPRLLAVWDDTNDISCLLPMQALAQGRAAVTEAFNQLLSRGRGIELSVTHLHWIETHDVAIHLVEETAQGTAPGGPPPPPVYASNIYRKDSRGWHLIVHQNTPHPPPPGMMPPRGG